MKTITIIFALLVLIAPAVAQLPDDWKTRPSTPEDDKIERAEHVKSLKGIGPSTDKDGRDWTTRPSTPKDDQIERAWHVYCVKSVQSGGNPNQIEHEWRDYLAKVAKIESDPNCKKGPDGICIGVMATTGKKEPGLLTVATLLMAKAKANLADWFEALKKGDPKAIIGLSKLFEPRSDSEFIGDTLKAAWDGIKAMEAERKKGTVPASRIKHSTDVLVDDPSSQQTITDCVNIIDPSANVRFVSEPKFVPGVGFVNTLSVHIEWSGNIPSPVAMKCLETGESKPFTQELTKRNYDRMVNEDRRRYEAWDRENRTGNRD